MSEQDNNLQSENDLQNEQLQNSVQSSSDELQVGTSITVKKINNLRAITDDVRLVFEKEQKALLNKVHIFIIIAVFFAALILLFYFLIIVGCLKPDFKKESRFELSYDIGVRIIIISLFISIITFCIKMMRIYLSLYEQVRHKIAVVKSLPTLVFASGDQELFKNSFAKIIEMLIQLGSDAIKDKDSEPPISLSLNELLKSLKDISKSEKKE